MGARDKGPASILEAFMRDAERVPERLCLRFEGRPTESARDFCRKDIAGYKKPREVTFVGGLRRHALGKVLEHEVREKPSETED
jgi:acyl-CoA synthetase (AMP-forming)/AMP-acid ligase II